MEIPHEDRLCCITRPPMLSAVSRLWSRKLNASVLKKTSPRPFPISPATRLAAPYTTDMDRVPTSDRLQQLRELMQRHKVDIYSMKKRRLQYSDR